MFYIDNTVAEPISTKQKEDPNWVFIYFVEMFTVLSSQALATFLSSEGSVIVPNSFLEYRNYLKVINGILFISHNKDENIYQYFTQPQQILLIQSKV